MNYDWTQSLCFAIIQKPMEKSYWIFVEESFMLTADPPTKHILNWERERYHTHTFINVEVKLVVCNREFN